MEIDHGIPLSIVAKKREITPPKVFNDCVRRKGQSDVEILATGQEAESAVVECDDECVTCRHPGEIVESVKWSDLQVIVIRTTADGPAADDIFWVLLGEKTGCNIPSEAIGIERVLERLYKLPGFDFGPCIEAMTWADEREFLCWKKDG